MSTVVNPPAEPITPPATPAPAPTPPPATPPAPTPAEPPAVPPTEITYDVKLTADSPLDAKADLDKVVAFAKVHRLSNEQAQSLMKDVVEDVSVRLVMRQKQQAQQAVETAKAKFLDEAKADPVIGGAKFDDTVRDVERALNWAAVQAPDAVKRFRQEIGQTPYGNYPPYLQIFAAFGRAIAPDPTPISTGGPGSGKGPKDLKEALYGPKTG